MWSFFFFFSSKVEDLEATAVTVGSYFLDELVDMRWCLHDVA